MHVTPVKTEHLNGNRVRLRLCSPASENLADRSRRNFGAAGYLKLGQAQFLKLLLHQILTVQAGELFLQRVKILSHGGRIYALIQNLSIKF